MLIRSIKYVWAPVNTRAEMGVHRVQQLKFIKRLGEHHLWKSDLSSWRVIEAQVIRVSECRMLKVYSAEHHTRVLFVVEFSRVTADSFCVKTDCDLDRTQTKCCQFNASHRRYSRTISMLITSSHVWIKLKNNPCWTVLGLLYCETSLNCDGGQQQTVWVTVSYLTSKWVRLIQTADGARLTREVILLNMINAGRCCPA